MIHYDTTNYTASLWSSSSQQVIIDIATGLVYYIDEQDVLIRMNAQFQQRDERSFYVSNLQRYQEDLDFNTRIYIIELPEGDLNYWKELSQHNPGLYVTARAYKTQVPDAIGIWGKWIGASDGSIYLNENQIMNKYGKIKEFTPPTEGHAISVALFTLLGRCLAHSLDPPYRNSRRNLNVGDRLGRSRPRQYHYDLVSLLQSLPISRQNHITPRQHREGQ